MGYVLTGPIFAGCTFGSLSFVDYGKPLKKPEKKMNDKE
jgi:hypothetical protein